jgi:hypothetical protein
MVALVPGVLRKANEEMASRKLGEAFKLISRSNQIAGYVRLISFSCLVRSKPRNWLAAASQVIADTDRNTFYLRAMLDCVVDQFHDEINTTAEREDLKRLVAIVKLKRDFKKDNPGERDIQNFLARMDKQNFLKDLESTASSSGT